MSEPRRSEVWWAELEDLGRRPFLVLTRPAAIPILHSVVTAPVTRTVRNIPSELRLGTEDGMATECAVNYDNLRVVPKAHLVERQCALEGTRLLELSEALRISVDC